MDAGWLEAANDAIDKFADRIVVGTAPDKGSKTLAGTGRPDLGGLFELPKPYCDPFREMIAPSSSHTSSKLDGGKWVPVRQCYGDMLGEGNCRACFTQWQRSCEAGQRLPLAKRSDLLRLGECGVAVAGCH